MSRVQIYVYDTLLGDISVEQDDRVGSYSSAAQREAIAALLRRALEQVNRAYALESEATR